MHTWVRLNEISNGEPESLTDTSTRFLHLKNEFKRSNSPQFDRMDSVSTPIRCLTGSVIGARSNMELLGFLKLQSGTAARSVAGKSTSVSSGASRGREEGQQSVSDRRLDEKKILVHGNAWRGWKGEVLDCERESISPRQDCWYGRTAFELLNQLVLVVQNCENSLFERKCDGEEMLLIDHRGCWQEKKDVGAIFTRYGLVSEIAKVANRVHFLEVFANGAKSVVSKKEQTLWSEN